MSDAIADVLNWLESRSDIQSLRAAVCDLNGIMRGKRIPLWEARGPDDGSALRHARKLTQPTH